MAACQRPPPGPVCWLLEGSGAKSGRPHRRGRAARGACLCERSAASQLLGASSAPSEAFLAASAFATCKGGRVSAAGYTRRRLAAVVPGGLPNFASRHRRKRRAHAWWRLPLCDLR
ncbi:Piso0_004246 [Millerozyma farinosa CBS 7064]|uniref:Piso0_004246 protein n=1 Tax=Pichia sorbitophila (strain ATCC MYA-4447 / BCRC 22081 / CBS 7064 / NBRC 10061 / NRRL Y-12695) TaxID=559304 RepID=G8YAZ7_PICSO|nr:Piso0_004246 [Millerozyma farinosa CBS 7064]CCE84692.1 Piso0_004246 [Millerozyma farinosa CBS 7064]